MKNIRRKLANAIPRHFYEQHSILFLSRRRRERLYHQIVCGNQSSSRHIDCSLLASKRWLEHNSYLRCRNSKSFNMYSSEDFENFYVRYKAEALPKGISIQSWCLKNKVSYLFNKWVTDTRFRIATVEIDCRLAEDTHRESPASSLCTAPWYRYVASCASP